MRFTAILPLALAASPVLAGDQYVTVMPDYVFVTKTDTVYSMDYSSGPITGGVGNDSLAASGATAAPAATVGGQVVATSGLSRGESDALYARLLAEAKARKLR